MQDQKYPPPSPRPGTPKISRSPSRKPNGKDLVKDYLEIGVNDLDEVVINHPALKPNERGTGHIVFSPGQARHLASLLFKYAVEAQESARRKIETRFANAVHDLRMGPAISTTIKH